jgi:hypothetical protein
MTSSTEKADEGSNIVFMQNIGFLSDPEVRDL